MADQAGIELILSAPNVKPIMDSVIDDWKEINKQEKAATEQLERFNAEMAEQQLRMKEIALSNQKIKDAVKELDGEKKKLKQTTDEQIDRDLFASEHQQKGIFGTIKAYFQQRGELKNLGKEIDSVNSQLRNLDLRQQAISLSARRGNTVAIKEYNANEKAIQKLNGSLSDLNEKYNVTGAKLDITKGKFSGLAKGFGIVKAGAVAAAAAIAIVGAVALAAIFAIGRQNDQVRNQFEKVGKLAGKVKTQLSDALAPIAFTFGKIFEGLLERFSNMLEESGSSIFQWSARVAGVIAGTFKFIGVGIEYTVLLFRKLGAEIDVVIATVRAGNALVRGDFEGYAQAAVSIGIAGAKLAEANKNFAGRKDALEEAKKTADAVEAELLNLGQAYFKVRNLTDEQRKALEALRAEYAKLTAEISKQIEALNVKEAGPFAGVLLKAELAAREIEALGEKAVSVAEKLGKSQAKINEIKNATLRLAQAVRDDAVKFLTDQADDTLDAIQNKLDELKAARTGTTEDLKFKKDIEAQFKLLDEFQQNVTARIEHAKNNGEDVTELIAELERGSGIALQLANITALDFASKKAIEILEKNNKAVKEKAGKLEEVNERLKDTLSQLSGDNSAFANERRISIQASLRVNEVDLAVAKEQIKQFEESFDLFDKTGVPGVVETQATIKVRVEQEQGINNIKPGDTSGIGVGGRKPPVLSLTDGLDLAVGLSEIAFDTITNIAVSSVDAQIEANERLIQSRQDTVNDLRDQVELEAKFKALGLANDYQIRKKQLDDAIKLEQEATAKQAELNEKKAKAEQRINDLQTLSSLTTSVANIIKGWSTVPFVGTALGIAAAAGMLVSFAASKIQAAKLARAYKGSKRMGETFGQMAPGEGYDDSPGVDRGLSVVDSRGRLRGFVGGDEYMHKQSVSRKHRKGFEYLNENEGKFANVNLLAMLKAMENNSIGPAFELPDMTQVPRVDYTRITSRIEKHREMKVVVNNVAPSITKEDLEEAVEKAMKKHAQTMMDFHDSRPDIIPNEWLKDYTQRTSKSTKQFKKV